MKRRIWFVLLGIVLCGGTLSTLKSRASRVSGPRATVRAELPPDPSECLALESDSGEAGHGIISVRGVLRNDCGRSFRYVEVRFRLLDRDGAVSGTAWANQANLGAGERWRFKASAFSDASRYRLESLSAR
jgi:hypothetical protein